MTNWPYNIFNFEPLLDLNYLMKSNLLKSVACRESRRLMMDDSGEGAERTGGQGRPLHLSSQGWLGHMLFASLHSLSLDL